MWTWMWTTPGLFSATVSRNKQSITSCEVGMSMAQQAQWLAKLSFFKTRTCHQSRLLAVLRMHWWKNLSQSEETICWHLAFLRFTEWQAWISWIYASSAFSREKKLDLQCCNNVPGPGLSVHESLCPDRPEVQVFLAIIQDSLVAVVAWAWATKRSFS